MTPKLSVIVCTHNPRLDYLVRTLDALKAQTLAKDQWELLIIDNASKSPVKEAVQLDWHPFAACIREDELGLTPARLRGMRDSSGALLVFVDDDNLLNEKYLEAVLRIADKYAFLGAWGAGEIRPEFQVQPPDWTREYWGCLAIHAFNSDIWSNLIETALPCGAGLCVRREVVKIYLEKVTSNPLRFQLGRKGTSLASCEDSDLALTSRVFGLGHGLFRELKITHLIPPGRLEEAYLLRLVEESTCSKAVYLKLLGAAEVPRPSTPARRWLGKLRRLLTMPPRQRRFLEARMRGFENAARMLDGRKT